MARSSFVARTKGTGARTGGGKKCLKISFEIADVIRRAPTAVELWSRHFRELVKRRGLPLPSSREKVAKGNHLNGHVRSLSGVRNYVAYKGRVKRGRGWNEDEGG